MAYETTRPSLLSRVRDPSDQASWREFESCYRELIIRYCRTCGLQLADAEDINQTVLMSLMKSLRNFGYDPKRGKFRHYLGRAVRNEVSRYLARPESRGERLDTGRLAELSSGDDEQDATWEQEWIRHHYRLALETVRQTHDPRSVEVFDRLVSDMPVKDVAAEFAMTEQAVHKVKQRIRKRMQELIEQQILEEDEPDETDGP